LFDEPVGEVAVKFQKADGRKGGIPDPAQAPYIVDEGLSGESGTLASGMIEDRELRRTGHAHVLLDDAEAVQELLRGSERRLVQLLHTVNQAKARSEFAMK
jgi:hypothetical protein